MNPAESSVSEQESPEGMTYFVSVAVVLSLPVPQVKALRLAAVRHFERDGSDGTRTRDLRRDRPAF